MLTWMVGLLLAWGSGVILGLLGGGGSVLALPILVYVMGIAPKSAIAMTLVIVGSISVIGAIPHWRRGYINFKLAALFGSATMLGAFLGAKIALLPVVTDTFQMLLFAVAMLLAAGLMIRRSRTHNLRSLAIACKLHNREIVYLATAIDQESRYRHANFQLHNHRWLWLVVQGIGVGILTGLVGVGGGFVIVPALVLLGGVEMRSAIGTSLLVIVLNSVAGFLGYLGQVWLDWHLIAAFILVAGIGTVAGASLSRYVDSKQLQTGFGYFLLAVAVFILIQNRGAFHWI